MELNNKYLQNMDKVIDELNHELNNIQLGRANISMVKDIKVISYGEVTPLEYAATITIPSALQILIIPFDKDQIKHIIESIIKIKPELNPQDNGSKIIINIPQLTQEKRLQQVKLISTINENAKRKIRNIRHEELENIKKNISSTNEQDIAKEQLQKNIDTYSRKIMDICKNKENILLKI